MKVDNGVDGVSNADGVPLLHIAGFLDKGLGPCSVLAHLLLLLLPSLLSNLLFPLVLLLFPLDLLYLELLMIDATI